MTSRGRLVVVLASLGLALSGCGGGSDHPAADHSASATKATPTPTDDPTATDAAGTSTGRIAPALGDIQKTKYFSYRAPRGWQGPATPAISGPASFVGDSNDHDGFTDNVNVIRVDPAPAATADGLQQAALTELKGGHAAHVKVLSRQDVAGSTAIHITSVFSQNGVKYVVNQFAMLHDKVSYVVTFSFSADVTPARQNSIVQSVLSTWKWAS